MTAPKPAADTAKYSAFAARMPQLENTLLRPPYRKPWETTSKTAGPGLSESAVSVTRKSHQVRQLIKGSHAGDSRF
jgi:hypothetical protein